MRIDGYLHEVTAFGTYKEACDAREILFAEEPDVMHGGIECLVSGEWVVWFQRMDYKKVYL